MFPPASLSRSLVLKPSGNNVGETSDPRFPVYTGVYHPTRTPFFSKEFVNFVKLGNQQGWDLKTHVLGFIRGAMGMGQFMPSSFELCC